MWKQTNSCKCFFLVWCIFLLITVTYFSWTFHLFLTFCSLFNVYTFVFAHPRLLLSPYQLWWKGSNCWQHNIRRWYIIDLELPHITEVKLTGRLAALVTSWMIVLIQTPILQTISLYSWWIILHCTWMRVFLPSLSLIMHSVWETETTR